MCLYYVIFVDMCKNTWHSVSGNIIISTKNLPLPQDYESSSLEYTHIYELYQGFGLL